MTDSQKIPYHPHDREVVTAAIEIWNSDKRTEQLNVDQLYRVILKNKPTWKPLNDNNNKNDDSPKEQQFPPFTIQRLNSCLTQFNMAPSQLEVSSYADKIKSIYPVPGLEIPKGSASTYIEVKQLKSNNSPDGDEKYKGKGIFAKISIPSKTTIWTEQPLLRAAPVSRLSAMRSGLACSHCGHQFANGARGTVACSLCPARFCSPKCRAADIPVHAATWHVGSKGSKTSHIKPKMWQKYEDYCAGSKAPQGSNGGLKTAAVGAANTDSGDGPWQTGYAVGIALIKIITETQKSPARGKMLREQFEAMATIPQDVRQQIADKTIAGAKQNSGGSLFATEQTELVWEKGYELLLKAVSKVVSIPDEDLQFEPESVTKNTTTESSEKGGTKVATTVPFSYKQYLRALGTWNLNNIGGCVFLLQSNLNHSCEPNVDIKFPPETSGNTSYLLNPISVVALREIGAGEELTISYVNPEWTFKQRQENLKTNWGFECSCSKCKREKKEIEITVDEEGNIFPSVK